MKDRIARLLFAYMARMGLLLCVGDPEASVAATPAAPAPTGAASDQVADPASEPQQQVADPEADLSPAELKALLAETRKEKAKLERRIGRKTATVAQLNAQLAQQQSSEQRRPVEVRTSDPDDDYDDAPTLTRAEAERLALERASEIDRGRTIASRTQAMLEKGAALNPQFRELALDVAETLPFVERGKPTEFIEAVLDRDAPEAVLLHIQQNDDVAESLRGLKGYKLGAALAKIEQAIAAAPAQPSKLPKPLAPVGGRGTTEKSERAMSDEEWRAARINKRA